MGDLRQQSSNTSILNIVLINWVRLWRANTAWMPLKAARPLRMLRSWLGQCAHTAHICMFPVSEMCVWDGTFCRKRQLSLVRGFARHLFCKKPALRRCARVLLTKNTQQKLQVYQTRNTRAQVWISFTYVFCERCTFWQTVNMLWDLILPFTVNVSLSLKTITDSYITRW